MPTSFSFPNELVDAIIDHNHDDRKTLLATALVSRQWTRASRYHVFTEVKISHQNAREFLGLLTIQHCTFTAALQSLDIELVAGSQRWLGECFRRLLSLERINISSMALSGPSNTVVRDEAVAAIALHSQEITRFTVAALVFDSFTSFAGLLCCFPALQHLSCAATFRTVAPLPGLAFACPLRSLALVSPAIAPVFTFLHAYNVLPIVTALTLAQPAVSDFAALAPYLRAPNDSLQTLRIRMDVPFSGVSLDSLAERFSLARLTVLRHLVVETTPRLNPDEAFGLLATAAPEARIETLQITVALGQGAAQIDIFLSTDDRFASLQSVIVLRASRGEVHEVLPRCDAKNILKHL
ncbi:hypothetical protein HYPSUDRAFT_964250 [Hypholoma sublateritium FD-334 SS-4]|uniref:F-box domain-containing protein n=1 Tax=Hypholoma sublateritium (strain FD-334 SS-4) TaxID=945553 RepID=A0A0D2NH42_HYPSF|nr:hypothetical protein HYPSUDRAFT_964250 [Hypholoma sublateritium FD-334 SS-4]